MLAIDSCWDKETQIFNYVIPGWPFTLWWITKYPRVCMGSKIWKKCSSNIQWDSVLGVCGGGYDQGIAKEILKENQT